MSIDELCYKGIGSAMAVHRHFGTGYLEELHKNALIFTLRFEIRNNLKTGKNNFEEVRGQLARAFSIMMSSVKKCVTLNFIPKLYHFANASTTKPSKLKTVGCDFISLSHF